MKEINYDGLVKNIDEMVNLLEYDSMRSAGKVKINAPQLAELIKLREHYAKKIKSPKKEG